MKRYGTTFVLTLTLALVLAIFAACGISNNPKATKQSLEEKDYTVQAVIGDNDLDAQAQLDSLSDEMDITSGELVAMISATKGTTEQDVPENFIYIYYFKDGTVANRFWDSNQTELNELKSTYKDADGFQVKKMGSVVYFGTKQAIMDAM